MAKLSKIKPGQILYDVRAKAVYECYVESVAEDHAMIRWNRFNPATKYRQKALSV